MPSKSPRPPWGGVGGGGSLANICRSACARVRLYVARMHRVNLTFLLSLGQLFIKLMLFVLWRKSCLVSEACSQTRSQHTDGQPCSQSNAAHLRGGTMQHVSIGRRLLLSRYCTYSPRVESHSKRRAALACTLRISEYSVCALPVLAQLRSIDGRALCCSGVLPAWQITDPTTNRRWNGQGRYRWQSKRHGPNLGSADALGHAANTTK